MQNVIAERLAALKVDQAAGEQQLHQLEMQTVQLKRTLERIAGAIHVLEELLENSGAAPQA